MARLKAADLHMGEAFSLPLHLLVASDTARRDSRRVRCHVCRTPLPEDAFALWSHDVYLSSPAFCFLQMAESLSIPRLILLGCELCGTYRPSSDPDAPLKTRKPLASAANLTSFIDRMAAPWPTQRARVALAWVVDGAASPLEGVVVILLCLPRKHGGYALPKPHINYRIEIPDAMRNLTDRRYFSADFCWPEHRLIVEYDSDAHHTGPDRIARDSARRNALNSMGYRVITLTTRQLFDAAEFDRVAQQIAHHLGIRQRPVDYNLEERREALRADLLGAVRRHGA